jgi:hypothetical protein
MRATATVVACGVALGGFGVLVAAGCVPGRLLARAEPVSGPDGARAWTVECERMALCFKLAGKYCPDGYTVLNDSSAQESSGSFARVNNIAKAEYSSRNWITLLIQCKGDETRAEKAPPAVAPGSGSTTPDPPRGLPTVEADSGASHLVPQAPF